jgi:hypothetical protein
MVGFQGSELHTTPQPLLSQAICLPQVALIWHCEGLLSPADVASTLILILLHPHYQTALFVKVSAALDACG